MPSNQGVSSWTSLVAEMAAGNEHGREYRLTDQAEWSALSPLPGEIIEVELSASSRAVFQEAWAAFYIMSVRNEMDGSHVLECHFLGCEDEVEGAGLQAMFQDGPQLLHLCLSTPCVATTPLEGIHCTVVRLWKEKDFKADYVEDRIKQSIKLWKKDLGGAAPKRRARRPTPKAEPGDRKGKKKEDGEKRKVPKSKALDAAKREELKEKLKKVRKLREEGGEREKSPVEVVSGSEVDGELGSEDGTSGYSPSETLVTGAELNSKPEKKRKKREAEKDREGNRRQLVPYKDTSGGTTKGLNKQLAQKALAVTDARDKAKRQKQKRKKKDSAVELLRKILTGSKSSHKEGKKDKSKKRKRRRLRDGVIVSSSNSSDSETESPGEVEEASSEEDLEAPMRKRSRDAPGSVLSLLTEHVREQMEQEAVTEVPHKKQGITSGVKVTSFFNLHVRPAYSQSIKEMREMYMLAVTIDLLRKGDLARVGDSLASRFMAIHQALVDQSWQTARHMELFPLEEATATSSALILASRKHSRLVEKVQGKGQWGGWQGRGKGSQRPDWGGWQEGQQKGKKGKGGSPKGKGKTKGKWSNAAEPAANEWEKNKDKGESSK